MRGTGDKGSPTNQTAKNLSAQEQSPLSHSERGASKRSAASGVCPGRRGAHQPNQQQHTTASNPTPTPNHSPSLKSQKSQFRQHANPTTTPTPFENQHIHATIKNEPVRDSAALTSADPLSQAATGECVKTVNATTDKKRDAAPLNDAPGCASLRPNGLRRRTAPDPESGERPLAYVRSESSNKSRSRRSIDAPQNEPDVGQTTSKGRVSVRECGRRLPSIATRGRLQRGPGRNRAMEDGENIVPASTSDPSVWRRRARLVRVASGLASPSAAIVRPPCKPSPAAEAVARWEFPEIRERAGFPSRNPSTPSSGRGR